MKNNQIGRGLTVAMMLALMMVAAKPAFADDGMGGPSRDTCFFAQGVINSIPAGTPGKSIVVSALNAVTGCGTSTTTVLHE
jgi:succinyl-CoA synthetase beta subunit